MWVSMDDLLVEAVEWVLPVLGRRFVFNLFSFRFGWEKKAGKARSRPVGVIEQGQGTGFKIKVTGGFCEGRVC